MPLQIFSAAMVALPWLWPFTGGPLAAVMPYLCAMAVAGLLCVFWPRYAGLGAALASAGWAAAAALSALIALLQYFDLERTFSPLFNVAEPGQAFGNLRQPNQLATLLVIGLLALGWLHNQRRLSRVAVGALSGLMLAALAATASRVGLVELLAVALLALWWASRAGASSRSVAWSLAAGASVYVFAALLLPWALQHSEGLSGRALVDRLQHAESTCGSRLILWSNVIDLIRQKPWTGWGWGELAYAHYITLFDGPRFCHILDNAHNLPLHLAVELGVPAAVLVCGAMGWLIWRGKPWAETDPTRQLAWGVLLAIGLHSLVEYPLWYGPFQIAVGLCIWMLWTTPRRPAGAGSYQPDSDMALPASSTEAAAEPSATGAVRLTIAAAMLAAVAYAGWDYHRISQIYLPAEQRSAWYRDDAMGNAQKSWLFADSVRFAEVTTRPVTRDNAPWMLLESLKALHFSPEPRVITKVIESATVLGREDLAIAHLARFKAAFPDKYRQWSDDNRRMAERVTEFLQGGASAASADSAASAASQ